MIEVNERIEVASPPQAVWAILSDPTAVVECVEGATLGDKQDDGSFDAKLIVKFGPAKVSFAANVMVDYDEANQSGNVIARGKDAISGTKFRTTMHFSVTGQDAPPDNVRSEIPIKAECELTGRLSNLIESGANLVIKRMTASFAEKLAERCGGTKAS
jgi:carbon monoxide dehydrogenase subunit G